MSPTPAPFDTDSLFRQAFGSHQRGDLAAAARDYALVLERSPTHFDALQLFGVLHYQQGEAEKALALLDRALTLRQDSAGVHSNRALALNALGRRDAAVHAFGTAIALAPAHLDAQLGLANTLLEDGRPDAALAALDRALRALPNVAELRFLRGLSLFELQRQDAALIEFDRALALDPGHLDASFYRGVVLSGLERFAEAAAAFRRVVDAQPDNLAAQSNLAGALESCGQPAEALAIYDRILAHHGASATLLTNRAIVLLALERPGEALESCERSLALQSDTPKTLATAALALLMLDRPREAYVRASEALALKPDYAKAIQHQASALMVMGDAEAALEAFERVHRLAPGDPIAEWDRCLCLLSLGRFTEAWQYHDAGYPRPKGVGIDLRQFAQPAWNGKEDLRGKTILLHHEEGFGDTLQFIRYARKVEALGARVLLDVPPALQRLVAHSYPELPTFTDGDALPPFDLRCSIMRLPIAFRTTLETIPAEIPYLVADPGLQARWAGYLAVARGKPRIGIVWAGNPKHTNDRNRSLPHRFLAPLLADARFQFVILQKDIDDTCRDFLAGFPDLLIPGQDLLDFAETAALVSQLDLVISVDTSVLHLAGALGVRTWALHPLCAEWRWLVGRSDSPWYPGMRLYRQQSLGDWAGVVERIRADLATLPA